MAVFHVYIDESGKLAKGDYTSLCGFIAHGAEWERFGDLWNSCRLAWQIPPIHMAQIMRPEVSSPKKNEPWAKIRKDWGTEWVERRDALLKDLSSIIGGTGLVAIGAVVESEAYREIHASEPILEKMDSNVFALNWVAMRSIDAVMKVDPQGTLSLVIDDDEEHAVSYYDLVKGLQSHPDKNLFGHVSERIHGICFCNDVSYPGIQAADMLAWVSRDYMVSTKKSDPTLPSHLFQRITRNGMHQPTLFTGETLQRVVRGAIEAQRIANEEQ